MKRFVCITLVCCIAQMTACAEPAENKALFNQINAHWNSRSYSKIRVIIDARKQADPNDVLALALEQYYYVFADKDIPKAHAAAKALKAITDASPNSDVKNLGANMTKRVTDIPMSENDPYTPEQRDALHDSLDRFPHIQECFVLWGLVSSKVE